MALLFNLHLLGTDFDHSDHCKSIVLIPGNGELFLLTTRRFLQKRIAQLLLGHSPTGSSNEKRCKHKAPVQSCTPSLPFSENQKGQGLDFGHWTCR